ncbi:receptor/non-receptor type protein-tyrosine phosphatase [Hesseltinella vesiculosa]|uniref:Receptor/non-receptor type protein-tyrosine phosphatase n=1 Tax=Hesseltinella vesiculosa TaxID=101127 RepID=A0A1X2G4E2_9FUNG|nr:receptor/non-receptor type protein-tyrosine phosphatase [Hesseltinella vesiculosa]
MSLQRLMTGRTKPFEKYAIDQFQRLDQRTHQRYDGVDHLDSPFCQQIANEHLNDGRNRYMDIIPFDYNRVKLGDLGQSNDYINASWIGLTMPMGRRYIACQGPLRHTCGDFWRMVLEQDVHVIVNLTPEMEKGRVKCAAYWPKTDEPGDLHRPRWRYHVKHLQAPQMRPEADCLHRRLEIVCYEQQGDTWLERKRSTVDHLHFLGWPDYGTPTNSQQVAQLIRLANQCQDSRPSPMVVHCSAGCGRTGTFVVIDSVTRWLSPNPSPVPSSSTNDNDSLSHWLDPVYLLTDVYRQQRVSMVQSPPQYLFCYQAIWDMLQ